MKHGFFLRLRSTAALDNVTLSSIRFGSAPATIALSEHIRVAFGSLQHPGSDLTHDQLGCTALEAWNASAARILDDASHFDSSTFLVRPLRFDGHAFQLRVRGSAISQWVAHPTLFSQLTRCASQVLETDDVVFHVLGKDTVVATACETTAQALTEIGLPVDKSCFFPHLRYYQGFPVRADLGMPSTPVFTTT